MGKRKSSRAKPVAKKRMEKLDTAFCCPFCNHGSSVECDIDMKNMIGRLSAAGGGEGDGGEGGCERGDSGGESGGSSGGDEGGGGCGSDGGGDDDC
ncbi:transcription elongation factor 1 homolog [Prunus persica]|uniref:transcription elongation factor 1 homolog n=1 Tax=Prunus persica TaxID=3760 RepID=UPI0009AB6FA9|nr:transcription elongation factor 1 homolog [Prunus persica]